MIAVVAAAASVPFTASGLTFRPTPVRVRAMIRTALILLLLLGTTAAAVFWPRSSTVDSQALDTVQLDLLAEIQTLWRKSGMKRSDGYIYAVDVGHLLIHAALTGDRVLYDTVKGADWLGDQDAIQELAQPALSAITHQ